MPGTIAASAVVVAAWALLIHTSSVTTIWPIFGTANQLLAGLALVVGTTALFRQGKWKYAWTTAVPAAFMFVTTLTAAFKLSKEYMGKTALSLAAGQTGEKYCRGYELFLVATMAALTVTLVVAAGRVWADLITNPRNSTAQARFASNPYFPIAHYA